MITIDDINNELSSLNQQNLNSIVKRIILEDMKISLETTSLDNKIKINHCNIDICSIDDMADELEYEVEDVISNFMMDAYDIVSSKNNEIDL